MKAVNGTIPDRPKPIDEVVGEFRRLSVYSSLGLAVARENRAHGKYLHICSDGKPFYEKRFDFAGEFIGGRAMVREGRYWYHIKPDGTPAYQDRYDQIGPFPPLVASARKNGNEFLIGPDGEIYADLGADR